MDKEPTTNNATGSRSEDIDLELKYVRNTYDNIATHFSDTRYNKWPRIHKFVKELPIGSILLDVGCGNGKYLDSNENVANIGCDSSLNLLDICRRRDYNVFACDMMNIPIKPASIDVVICIAALHHISSSRRRKECLINMVDILTTDGMALIYVWSFEQDLGKPSPYLKKLCCDHADTRNDNPHQQHGLPIHINRTPFIQQDVLVPFSICKKKRADEPGIRESSKDTNVDKYLRYYHVFKKGELDSLIEEIPTVKIVDSYYDNGNWCVLFKKIP